MKQLCPALIIINFLNHLAYADSVSNDCSTIMDVANKPSFVDSACSVPLDKVIFEADYINLKLVQNQGYQQNFPNLEVRMGIYPHSEFFVELPDYIIQNNKYRSGQSAVYGGLKRSINYSEKLLIAVEGIVTLPSGSYAFGSRNWAGSANVIGSYEINKKLNVTAMLSASSISSSKLEGGHSFFSINPDIVLTYSFTDKLSMYGELYGQSKAAYNQGPGFNIDAGLLVPINNLLLLNLSGGQRITMIWAVTNITSAQVFH